MTELRIVLCTFPDAHTARQIGTALIEKQLAACMNLIPSVESVYRWHGEIESAGETLAIIKTTASAWPGLVAGLRSMHPYETPEIVALDPWQACAAYDAWVKENVLPLGDLRDLGQ